MPERNPKTGFYLHIPFCRSRCGYCDFVSFAGQEGRLAGYVDHLCREITLHSQQPWGNPDPHIRIVAPAIRRPGPSRSSTTAGARPTTCRANETEGHQEGEKCFDGSRALRDLGGNRTLDTVFFGGGTPSLLEPAQVRRILGVVQNHFHLQTGAEITLEANPESVTPEKAAGWRQAGVNRLSLGLQAFDDELLKVLGRVHSVDQFIQAYQAARSSGFQNIGIDLIYGITGQSPGRWQNTVREAVALAPGHLSLYALTVEEHTPFHAQGFRVDEDQQARMYEWARLFLQQEGYEQYEISNFARPGKACRHNLIYWRQQDYIGAGAGAVGCVGGIRWQNAQTLTDYEKDVAADRPPWLSHEILDARTRKFERLMLGLRLREGLQWEAEDNPEWLSHRARLADKGWLEEAKPGRWRIRDAYIRFTNQVLIPFA